MKRFLIIILFQFLLIPICLMAELQGNSELAENNWVAGDANTSIAELERSLSFAKEANARSERSDTWRIMSEAESLLMLQNGFFYIIANYTRPQEQAKRALELDPENARATFVIAQYLSNAPSIAGGNLEEGIAMLAALLERNDLQRIDRFVVLQSLSEVLHTNNRNRGALMYCRRALRLYPGNMKCKELLSDLEKGA